MPNVFAVQEKQHKSVDFEKPSVVTTGEMINYNTCMLSKSVHIGVFILGAVVGFFVLFLFYRSFFMSLIGAILISPFIVRVNANYAVKKRKFNLRSQFRDMLEAMNVSMHAGSNEIKALQSAYNDLLLIYTPDTDIVREISNMLSMYQNGLPLRTLFHDFEKRSGLEDVSSFASIFEAIEGKSDRSTDIIRQTQQGIADKIQIESEIETMITSTKMEQYIMFCMPIVIVAAMNFMGEGFMDVIYTTVVGRIIATITIIIFVIAFFISKKITDIEV